MLTFTSDKLASCVAMNSFSVSQTAKEAVEKTVQEFGHLDILVNNASQQHVQESLLDITPEQLQKTFATNVFGYFYFAQVSLHWALSLSCLVVNFAAQLCCS